MSSDYKKNSLSLLDAVAMGISSHCENSSEIGRPSSAWRGWRER